MITLNLLGTAADGARPRPRLLWLSPLVLASSALCLVHTRQTRELAQLSGEVAGLQASTVELSRQIDEASRRNRANTELAARLGLIDKLGRHRGNANKLLTGVAGVVSERMWLLELSYASDALMVAGIADTPEEVAAFLARLSTLGMFAEVDLLELKQIPIRSPVEQTHYRFAVKNRVAREKQRLPSTANNPEA